MNRLNKIFHVAIVSIAMATPAFAQTDGSLGSTSSGTSDISVTITELARVTKVNNLAAGAYSGAVDGNGNGFDMADDVCIYTNASSGSYRVTLSGNYNSAGAAGTDFFVRGGTAGDTIAYSVGWNDVRATNSGETAATAGTAITSQTGYSTALDCGGATETETNARFHVTMTQADMLAERADTYTGTLTILIAPN
jgi:hypothetical protein